jgi:hypothetical protein
VPESQPSDHRQQQQREKTADDELTECPHHRRHPGRSSTGPNRGPKRCNANHSNSAGPGTTRRHWLGDLGITLGATADAFRRPSLNALAGQPRVSAFRAERCCLLGELDPSDGGNKPAAGCRSRGWRHCCGPLLALPQRHSRSGPAWISPRVTTVSPAIQPVSRCASSITAPRTESRPSPPPSARADKRFSGGRRR